MVSRAAELLLCLLDKQEDGWVAVKGERVECSTV